MNATLERMAQALFKSWFVYFDPAIDNALAAGNPIPEELTERAAIRRKALTDGTTVWLLLKQMAELFQRDKSVISHHKKNVFAEGELGRYSVVAEFATTAGRWQVSASLRRTTTKP